MKKLLLLLSILTVGTSLFAQNWTLDFETAKAKAAKENKKIIVLFQGSDWNEESKQLEKTTWSSEEFKSLAARKFMLVNVDFPKDTKISSSQKSKNEMLLEMYNPKSQFPYIVVFDSEGKVINRLDAEQFSISKLKGELENNKEVR